MDLLVTSFAPPNDIINATQAINNWRDSFNPYKKSLTAKAKKNIRAVGSSRYGLAKIVGKISTQYNDKLSKEDDAAELTSRMEYIDKVRQYKIAAQNLYESLDDTDKALGKDIMAHVDKFSSSLQIARQHDGDLDEAMKELDEYNARFGAIMEEEEGENAETPAGNQPLEPPAQA
ncbi:MAG: hypothetical protein WC756_03050 [Taibaiella sp.]|jgi:hypothetical protein